MTIRLPDKMTVAGAEIRILLAECSTPAQPGYSLALAKTAMQYMDAVLWNRVKNPKPYGAKSGATLIDIIKAPKQFAGFESYPNYASTIRNRIQMCLDIANDSKDSRNATYTAFVNAAIERTAAEDVEDPSPGHLVGWRTAGRGSPGPAFKEYATVLGNTFFWIANNSG
jgi:hypothetical protein